MGTFIFLKAKPKESNLQPERLECSDKQGDPLAIIYNNQNIKFVGAVTLHIEELNQIKTIADNFSLFYDNLIK